MNTNAEYKRILAVVEGEKEEKAKLKGSLSTIIKQLKAKGFKSPVEARNKRKWIEKKIEVEKRKLTQSIEKFKKSYADELQRYS